jgi:hypothetical protein
MKVLKYWKTVPLGLAGFTYELVPMREVREDESAFKYIVDVVKASDCDYTITEHSQEVLESRMQ